MVWALCPIPPNTGDFGGLLDLNQNSLENCGTETVAIHVWLWPLASTTRGALDNDSVSPRQCGRGEASFTLAGFSLNFPPSGSPSPPCLERGRLPPATVALTPEPCPAPEVQALPTCRREAGQLPFCPLLQSADPRPTPPRDSASRCLRGPKALRANDACAPGAQLS